MQVQERTPLKRLLAFLVSQRRAQKPGLTLAELESCYLSDLGSRASEGHLRRTRACIGKIIPGLPVELCSDLQPGMVDLYLQRRVEDDGASNRTANMELAALRTALNWAVRRGRLAENPLAHTIGLPSGRHTKTRVRRALEDDEVERFLEAARATDGARPKWFPQAPFWIVMLATGARWGELSKVLWGDVNSERRALRLRATNTKSRRERVIPLSSDALGVLRQLASVQAALLERTPEQSDRVFLSPYGHALSHANHWKAFMRLLAAAGIERQNYAGETVDIHALRKTAATRLIAAGADVTLAQKMLGHAHVQMTASTYVGHGLGALRSAVERVGCGAGEAHQDENPPPRLDPFVRIVVPRLGGPDDRSEPLPLPPLPRLRSAFRSRSASARASAQGTLTKGFWFPSFGLSSACQLSTRTSRVRLSEHERQGRPKPCGPAAMPPVLSAGSIQAGPRVHEEATQSASARGRGAHPRRVGDVDDVERTRPSSGAGESTGTPALGPLPLVGTKSSPSPMPGGSGGLPSGRKEAERAAPGPDTAHLNTTPRQEAVELVLDFLSPSRAGSRRGDAPGGQPSLRSKDVVAICRALLSELAAREGVAEE